MVWTTRDRKIQRRAERRGTGRVRRVTDEDRAEASAWAARLRDGRTADAPGGPVAFRQVERDGHPGYLIAGRWYRGHESDRIAAQREDAVLVRRSYGEADGDGLWRNIVVYDLRPDAKWRRIDLAWHQLRQGWRRCQGLTEARVSAPELLAWAEGEVRTWPRTLAERITAAEGAVGAMTQGGEVSAAITRALAFEPPVLGEAPRGRPRRGHG